MNAIDRKRMPPRPTRARNWIGSGRIEHFVIEDMPVATTIHEHKWVFLAFGA